MTNNQLLGEIAQSVEQRTENPILKIPKVRNPPFLGLFEKPIYAKSCQIDTKMWQTWQSVAKYRDFLG